MLLPGLLPALRERLTIELAGYPGLPEHLAEEFVSAPLLGGRAGSLGALVLARGGSEDLGRQGECLSRPPLEHGDQTPVFGPRVVRPTVVADEVAARERPCRRSR